MGDITGEDKRFETTSFDGLSSVVAAAHELKSPLALVRQLARSLETMSLSEAEQKRMLNQIFLTSERALRLTSDLTRSARLEDALFSMEPINPKQLCEEVIHEMSPLFAAYGQRISLAPRVHSTLLVGNRDLLRRIILNFSDNALHYAEGNEVVELQIGVVGKGEQIRLGVRDYGPALPIDIWSQLKKKLEKAPQSIHARPQSSGLGLLIASQFADAMKGRIGIVRHRDGATFYVDLQASRQLSLL